MRKLLMLELNEVNFGYVMAYGAKGELPHLNGLIARHGLTETISENSYELLEPWIQWVSAHTGKSFSEHQVFRLGDIVERDDLTQIWEVIEARGLQVGAISPMNARNGCRNADFFVPDPWTRSDLTASPLVKRIYAAIAQIVSDNATSKIDPTSVGWLGAGLLRFAPPRKYALYASIAMQARRKPWMRAMMLDLLLSDIFLNFNRQTSPHYATLFLNAAAHIQHHYMFSAAVYDGPYRNPDWYIASDADPVLDVYRLYDQIVGSVIADAPEHRIMITTGLHQDPYTALLFYWRLREHAQFLNMLGVPHERVEPRMSRDFVVFCSDAAQALEAERQLTSARADDGTVLFEVDNRGASLFVMLVYPHDIPSDLGFSVGNRSFEKLRDHCAFVAIKNGEHNGIGYLIDTDHIKATAPPRIALTDIFGIVRDNFERVEPGKLAA